MKFPNLLRHVTQFNTGLFAFLALLLASCGGGGGAVTTSAQSFPLQSAINASDAKGSSTSYSISGTCSGTASIVTSTPISASFEGVSGVSATSTTTINLTNCTPATTTSTSTVFYDTNFVPLGSVVAGGNYGVFPTPPSIPASVKVGNTGTIGTMKIYSDSTKNVFNGQDVYSYVIEPDTTNTAIVNKIIKSYDASGILTATEQDRYRITTAGVLTPVSSDVQLSNGSTTHLVLTVVPDTVPPNVLSASPPDTSTAVATGTAIAATFSEPMDASTVTTATFTLSAGSGAVAGTVNLSGTIATFTSSAPLVAGTLYTATISKNVKDLAGNAMVSNYSWSFTTVPPDTTPPTVSTVTPPNNAINIAINTPITATFSEALNPVTITGAEFTVMNGTNPVSGAVTYSGTTATFTPAAPLANNTLYTVTITTGVKDLAGNAMTVPYSWSFTSDKKISGLNFTVIDAEYNKSLDKIVMVSSVPSNQLHIYDPATDLDIAVNLNLAPSSVSVSPDGLFAAVGHNAWISYVDLSTATLVKTLPVTADVFDIVLAGNGYVYAFPRIDQWVQIHGINIATGTETLSAVSSIRAGTKAKLNANGTAIYGVTNGLSPDNIEKYDVALGAPAYAYRSPYWGTYPICGDLWMSEDGFRIFTKCGNVFNATSLMATDMLYGGALPNLSLIKSLSHSAGAGKVIAIPDNNWMSTNADTVIQIFGYSFLTFEQSINFPHFVVGNNQYAGHGRFVFYNSTGTKYFVVLQADTGSGMLYDYGVVTY